MCVIIERKKKREREREIREGDVGWGRRERSVVIISAYGISIPVPHVSSNT